MSTKKLSLYKETLQALSTTEAQEIGAGLLRDSIEIRCFSKPIWQNTRIVGNTCLQD